MFMNRLLNRSNAKSTNNNPSTGRKGRGLLFSRGTNEVIDENLKKRNECATVIQTYARRHLAIKRVKKIVNRVWERSFDPKTKAYFWYNNETGLSQWRLPKYAKLFNPVDIASANHINRVVRGFLGRQKAKKIAFIKYSRFFDGKLNRFYWLDKSVGKTFWNASNWLQKLEVPMAEEDQLLYNSYLKIKELENKLLEKDNEIKLARKQRFEELEPLVIADRVANAKDLIRSKDMDKWTIDELSAWFTELKMEEYIPFLYKNRVDGNLFINLNDDDWVHMGITNLFHTRKLQLILRSYRLRYQRKRDRIDVDEDEELVSEYSPSELSDIINREDNSEIGSDDKSDEEDDDDEVPDSADSFDGFNFLTLEQKQQQLLDDKNIRIDMLVPGDGTNFPMIGDIVRVRYVCTLASTGKVVQSTKNGMQRPSVEFVLGVNQLIKGIDRALPQMSVGERAKIHVSSEYAYGAEGLYPHILPQEGLVFDLTLLGIRPRLLWNKPLIQKLGAVYKPYEPSNIVLPLARGKMIPAMDDYNSMSGGGTSQVSLYDEDDI